MNICMCVCMYAGMRVYIYVGKGTARILCCATCVRVRAGDHVYSTCIFLYMLSDPPFSCNRYMKG